MSHYCESHYCGQGRSYWTGEDPGHELLDGVEASKAWLEDHDKERCAKHGGDCGKPEYWAALAARSAEHDKRIKDALWGGGRWWREHHKED